MLRTAAVKLDRTLPSVLRAASERGSKGPRSHNISLSRDKYAFYQPRVSHSSYRIQKQLIYRECGRGGAAVAPDINAPDISPEKGKGDGEKKIASSGEVFTSLC